MTHRGHEAARHRTVDKTNIPLFCSHSPQALGSMRYRPVSLLQPGGLFPTVEGGCQPDWPSTKCPASPCLQIHTTHRETEAGWGSGAPVAEQKWNRPLSTDPEARVSILIPTCGGIPGPPLPPQVISSAKAEASWAACQQAGGAVMGLVWGQRGWGGLGQPKCTG